MTGEQLRPLEGRPYLKDWQQRMAEKPVKVAKTRKKSRKKAKR